MMVAEKQNSRHEILAFSGEQLERNNLVPCWFLIIKDAWTNYRA